MEPTNPNPIDPTLKVMAQSADSMPKKSWLKGHMVLGIVFLVVVLAAIVAGICYWQTTSQIPAVVQVPVHKEKVDVTAGWKTYTNDQYGFEFKYPPEWELNERSLSVAPPGAAPLEVPFTVVPFDQSYETAQAQMDENSVKTGVAVKTDILVDGISAVKYSSTDLAAISADIIFVPFAGKTYQLNIIHTAEIDKTMQVLSTFKFRDLGYQVDSEGYLASGTGVNCNIEVNTNPPNSQVLYSSSAKGISFQVPYNVDWGNQNFKLRPYEEFLDHIVFGVLAGGEGCGASRINYLYFEPAKSAKDTIAELEKHPNYKYFVSKPKEVNLNGLTAVEYEGSSDLCAPVSVIVIGNKFNYNFTYDCQGDIKDLENIAKTVKLIK